jgi:hypothetical protein
MKVSEFEAKLGTVSDAKLLQMLAASRSQGPELAVSLILAETRRRGMEDQESPSPAYRGPERLEPAAGESGMRMAVATSSYPREGAGAFGADAPADAAFGMEPAAGGPEQAASDPDGTSAPADPTAPALAPEWLTEETQSGMPMALKALLFLAGIGGVLALAWKFTR